MNMDSFVITVGEFLHMCGEKARFDSNKTNYVIPKYQREYKWSDDRAVTLIADIKRNNKFLGNIILNAADDYYELVDGQQRITTIILILIALFNRNKHTSKDTRTEEQKKLFTFLMKNNKFILENESIGDYISVSETSIALNIKADDDIYFQNDRFNDLSSLIDAQIAGISSENLLDFQKKLLDSKVLVLIGTPEGKEQDSIEEVFLDINFKSQLLDVANIFKGYCFKNYDSGSHNELKKQWTTIMSHTKQFEKRFGYEENRETCEYLYLYLLSVPGSQKIPANLSWDGKHHLEDKNHTQTKELLVDMVNYGNHVIAFNNKLLNSNYFFEDICHDAAEHRDETVRLQNMKSMALITMQSKEAKYYKLPFFMFIHHTLNSGNTDNAPEFSILKALITNFYVYAFLFINSEKHKNKTLIAYNLLDILRSRDTPQEKAGKALNELKSIRKDFLEDFTLFRNFHANKGYAFYSIMDYYVANTNFIECAYTKKGDYTPEHLLIHDNPAMKVTWKDGVNEFSFGLKELLGKPDGKNYKGTTYKKQTANYLILPKRLNESIKSNDIVSKISDIINYYSQREKPVPKHISLLVENIREMPEYKDLVQLKGSSKSQETIKNKYKDFINSYFSDEKQAVLYGKLENRFKEVFRN